LDGVGAEGTEFAEAVGVLDAFGGDLVAEAVRHADGGLDDHRVGPVAFEGGDEAAVELDFVDGELLEAGQAGVPGDGVVQGQGDAQLVQAVEDLACRGEDIRHLSSAYVRL